MARATTPVIPVSLQGLDNTPVSKKASGSGPHTSLHHERDYRMRQVGAEMEGKFIGPMPVVDFLDTFLPLRSTSSLRWTKKRMSKFEEVGKQTSEKQMYKPIVRNLYLNLLVLMPLIGRSTRCNLFVRISNLSIRTIIPIRILVFPELLKPDISIYTRGCDRSRPTDFSLMESHIEVKFDENDDPFDDESVHSFEHDREASKDTKGQITSYAVAQLAGQFRTHIFTILVCGGYARILRWDRSGAVVTAAFDYCNRYLGEFFWRYDRTPPDDRGMELSISKPSDTEVTLARQYLRCSLQALLLKFAVYNDMDGKTSYYIGSKPSFKGNASPTGRATRTFIVFDQQTRRVVFLKDTWRIDLPDVVKEGEIYKILHEAKVPFIAPFLCGGDIFQHRTRTQDFSSERWARPIKNSLRPHQHYRLVLGVVGRDFTSFDSSWEMVGAIRDALQGTLMNNVGGNHDVT